MNGKDSLMYMLWNVCVFDDMYLLFDFVKAAAKTNFAEAVVKLNQ